VYRIWFLIYMLFAVWLPRSCGGRALRSSLSRHLLGKQGRDLVLEKGTLPHKRLFVGDRVQIGADCRFMIGGRVTLGDDVLLAPEIIFVDSNHNWDRLDVPIKDQGSMSPQPIVVEQGAWIGIRAVILPGVRIGQGAIVGAGAVVTRDIPEYAIAAGNPAKVVRFRKAPQEAE
jgi:maltose O-acetyltransferase